MSTKNNTAKAGKTTKQTTNAATVKQWPMNKSCYKCGTLGHVQANCPVKEPQAARLLKAAQEASAFRAQAVVAKPKAATKANVAVKSVQKVATMMHEDPAEKRAEHIAEAVMHEEGEPLPGTKSRHKKVHFEMGPDGGRGRGTEMIGSLELTSGNVEAGTKLIVQSMNPQMFGVRLPPVSSPYVKYRFTKLEFEYVPSITEFQPGSNDTLLLACSLATNQPIPNDVPTLMTWAGSRDDGREGKCNASYGHFTRTSRLNTELCLKEQIPLFIDSTSDQQFQVQATFAAVVAQDITVASDVTLGFVLCHYEIETYGESAPAYGSGAVMAATRYLPTGAVGNEVISTNEAGSLAEFTTWIGDAGIVIPVDFAATGGNFVLPPGVYVVSCTLASPGVVSSLTGPALGAASDTAKLLAATDIASTGVGGMMQVTPNTLGNNNGVIATPSNPVSVGKICDYMGVMESTASGPVNWWSSRWTVRANQGVPAVFHLTAPTTAPSGAQCFGTITFCRILNASDVNADQFHARTGPMDYLTAKTAALMAKLPPRVTTFDAATILAMTKFCVNAPEEDAAYVNVIIKAFDLGIPLRRYGPTTTFVIPALVWLARTFGPLIAAKMLDVGKEKLDKWVKDSKKKPRPDPDVEAVTQCELTAST